MRIKIAFTACLMLLLGSLCFGQIADSTYLDGLKTELRK